MAETVFTAKNLTKTYTSGEVQVQALRGLDLTVTATTAATTHQPLDRMDPPSVTEAG